LVLPLTANEQSLLGSVNTINRLRAAQDDLPLDHGNVLILPIISRFERRVEYELAERWLAKFAQKLAPFYKTWLHHSVKIEEILNFTRIPSIPFWSFGEELPVIEKGAEDPDDIGFPLETLAALVAQKFAFTDVLIQNRDSFVNRAKSNIKFQRELTEQQSISKGQNRQALSAKVFISYAYKDQKWLEELRVHLSSLERQAIIDVWSFGQIRAGVDVTQEINSRLEEADIILLLISSDYLASTSSDIEVMRSLERTRAGEAIVIPIILRPVDWRASPISELQALPSGARPISTWPDRDEALADVAEGIRKAVESLKKP
jgi:hypothetical protein